MPTKEIESEGRRKLIAAVTPTVTVGALATQLGVTPTAVSQWLAGATAPSRSNAAALETLTGIPASAWTDDATIKREQKRAGKVKRTAEKEERR